MSAISKLLNRVLHSRELVHQKLFQREVENYFAREKPYPLPKLEQGTIDKYYPFRVLFSEEERNMLKKFLSTPEYYDCVISSGDEICRQFSDELLPETKIRQNRRFFSPDDSHAVPASRLNINSLQESINLSGILLKGELPELYPLMLAYTASDNDKYRIHYFRILQLFSLENPIGIGIHWLFSGQIAVRVLNLFYSLQHIYSGKTLSSDEEDIVLLFFRNHLRFLEYNYSILSYREYEYILSLSALFCSSLLFPASHYAIRLNRIAKQKMESELSKIFLPDGSSRDQSFSSTAVTLHGLILAKTAADAAGAPFSDQFSNLLHKAFIALLPFLPEAHESSLFGDEVSPQLYPVSRVLPVSARFAFCPIAATAFKDPRIKQLSVFDLPIQELYGSQKRKEFAKVEIPPPGELISARLLSNRFFLRDKNISILVNASDRPPGRLTAGYHEDTLHFDLRINGLPIFIDSGTFSYFDKGGNRELLRSVAAHNTFYVDNFQPIRQTVDEGYTDITKPNILESKFTELKDFLSVQHYGFIQLSPPVIGKRSFSLYRNSGKIKVKDEFIGGGRHQIVSILNAHPGVHLEKHDDTAFFGILDAFSFRLSFHIAAEEYVDLSLRNSFYSGSLGNISESKQIALVINEQLPTFYSWTLEIL